MNLKHSQFPMAAIGSLLRFGWDVLTSQLSSSVLHLPGCLR